VPALLFWLACGLRELWTRGNRARAVVILFIGLNLGSAVSLRFAQRHAKDDYRTAAAIARDTLNRGERVWWCADEGAGLYYRVPFSPLSDTPRQVWLAVGATEG